MFRKCTAEEMALFVGLARRIWMRRKDVLHGGMFSHPTTLIQLVVQAIEDFRDAQDCRLTSSRENDAVGMTRWVAPSQGWVKANWDASVDSVSGCLGCGVVIRDDRGRLLEARCISR